MPVFKFYPKDGIILVEVKLTASLVTTARMVFDTGASLMMIPWKIATGIGLKIDPEKTIQTTTASTIETVPLVTIPKVNLLGEEVEDVEALVKDLPPEAKVDGLLGISFIKNFKVGIDFRRGQLTIEKISSLG